MTEEELTKEHLSKSLELSSGFLSFVYAALEKANCLDWGCLYIETVMLQLAQTLKHTYKFDNERILTCIKDQLEYVVTDEKN